MWKQGVPTLRRCPRLSEPAHRAPLFNFTHPQVQLVHLCEKRANRVVILAVVQQQEARAAGRDVRRDLQVVEPVHRL